MIRLPLRIHLFALVGLLTGLSLGPARVAAQDMAPADAARPIIIASDPWCPYACDPATDGREGYMVELAREIFQAAGYRVEYRVVNFAMLKRMLHDGSATAVPGAATDMGGALLLPALAQGNSANAVALQREKDFTYSKPDDFSPYRVGIIKDYAYGGDVQRYIDQHQANPDRVWVLSGFGYSQLVQGLRQIQGGGLDLLLDDYNVLRWQLRRLALDDQMRVVSLKDDADLFVGLSRSDARAPLLARLLEDGTRRLRAEGRFLAILARYGLHEQPMPER
ncbi:transporter substrate-binding domain-containing protein [Niveispirillum sp. BGYR6]|uniref:substrate-binding periplasmic protein n=1 Tax=Niveispirillum sp. BGYR6 TaxID=2971249 RepID=UPI0022B988D9|nr:transporter substrate-binding domain-containing protein [Niveispirillum sp. BGYR6]MDG5496823.1 transporter substrate-binding domain-containing protein [Niveispirillum sp. BGYR6]